MKDFTIRPARMEDVPLILALIRELADYENMLDQVTATEEILKEWLFEKKTAEVLIPQVGDSPIGYALFFHNFSTFLGKGGLYLEDVYIRPEYRGNGYGKAVFRELARIAEERDFYIISDEMYEALVYDGMEHVSIASLGSEIAARTITICGVSPLFGQRME